MYSKQKRVYDQHAAALIWDDIAAHISFITRGQRNQLLSTWHKLESHDIILKQYPLASAVNRRPDAAAKEREAEKDCRKEPTLVWLLVVR